MKLITKNEKWKLYLVDPDEVFDILGKGNGEGLCCRILKGKFQKTTHELRNLKVYDIKNYISAAKNNDPNEFIIFYRVVEKATNDDIEDMSPHHKELLIFDIDGIKVKLSREDVWRAEQTCIKSCDLTSYCPFFGRPNIEVGAGCRRILDAYTNGQYEVTNGLFEEVDE